MGRLGETGFTQPYFTLPQQVPLSSWVIMFLRDLWKPLSVFLAKLDSIFTGVWWVSDLREAQG